MLLKDLADKGMISPPDYVIPGLQYLTLMGSHAYGVATPESDKDVYGFTVPPRDVIYPHTAGIIRGFGDQGRRFDQWQQHHIGEYDFQVYNIVKYFQLLMDNNPNMLDSLYTAQDCILYASPIANTVRDNRDIFLHKGCYHRFKGYAYSQMHKIRTKNPQGKRKEMVGRYGYDVKFAYHIVRLCNECEQILNTGTMDLRQNNEQLKAIRRGEWTIEKLERWFDRQEEYLEECYQKSALPHRPDEKKIKALLLECLEDFHNEDSN